MFKKSYYKNIIIFSLLLLILPALACKTDPVDLTASNFFDALKVGDLSKASDYLFKDKNSSDFINSIFVFENEQQKELALKTFSKIEYKVKSSLKTSEDFYELSVEIKHVDFVSMTEKILPEVIEKTNPVEAQSQAEIDSMVSTINSIFIEKLSDSDVPMIKTTIKLLLFKDSAKTIISIIPDEDLLNVLSGNLIKAYEFLGEEDLLGQISE